jgi:hypothetical protein
MKKIGSVLITLLLMGSTLTAFADDSSKTIVQKIREANIATETTEKAPQKSFKERLKEKQEAEGVIMATSVDRSKLPKVAIMYVNNAKTTYDDQVDKGILKYLDKALPEATYELVDGAPYIEKLNKIGFMNIAEAERADIVDVFEGNGVDYCIFLEIEPFVARDKVTFFTVGKDMTTSIPFKIVDLATGKYLYVGKFTEKASDSTMIGGIGNKSVAMKALDNVGQKIASVIDVRLPKVKAAAK